MKRLSVSMIISFVAVFSIFNVTYAQESRTKNLHQAIVGGDIEQVKTLLSNGANINEINRLGGTPLHTALINKKQAIAELLISKSPDLNVKDNHGRTPLFLAIETDQKKIAELLLTKNVDVNAVARMGQNALTLARSKGDTELVALLQKHGAEEPVLNMEGDMYPGSRGGASRGTSGADSMSRVRPRADARPTTEPSVLSDPNAIKARIKTFAGLEKAIKDVNDKSDSEERQWCQTRYDNRSLLSRAVQSQFEEEVGLVRKTAEAEKAKKTIAAIDNLISEKKERSKKVGREMLQLRREQEQAQSTRGRSRGRTTSGRGVRGRSSMRGQSGNNMTDSLYEGGDTRGPSRSERPTRPSEQIDPQTEEEIRLWSQADPEKKESLAENVHQQILAEMESIRVVAVEEKAKKTTATIDGIMLARQERYNKLVTKIEEAQRKAEERQAQLENRGRGRSNSRLQNDTTQQNTQQRGRGRRR